jgi:uncharacterized protein YbjT (DUF2867 family)
VSLENLDGDQKESKLMKILLFGATGMVGDGVLRWLIASPKVSRVVAVSRKPLAVQHPKVEAVIEPDMFHLQNVNTLRDFDACFFCLGASSVGMSPEDYRRLTYDLTVAVARQLLPGNPRMVFEYISGEGTDAKSRQRWAQVKAETETALLSMGFRDAYGLRPGFIQPMRGVTSRVRSIRWMYALTAPVFPFLQKTFGRWVISTDLLAAAMLHLAVKGSEKKILNTGELNALTG